jgi:hypothetical protein
LIKFVIWLLAGKLIFILERSLIIIRTTLMGTGGKARPASGADHSPPSSADIKNE